MDRNLSTGVRTLKIQKLETFFYQTNTSIIQIVTSKIPSDPLFAEEAKVSSGRVEPPPTPAALPGRVGVPPPELSESPPPVSRAWLKSDIERVQIGFMTVTVVVIVVGKAMTAAIAGVGLIYKKRSATRCRRGDGEKLTVRSSSWSSSL